MFNSKRTLRACWRNVILPVVRPRPPPLVSPRLPSPPPQQGVAAKRLQRSYRSFLQNKGWQPTRPPTINGAPVDPDYYVRMAYPSQAGVEHPRMTQAEFERLAAMAPTEASTAWASSNVYEGRAPRDSSAQYDPSRADKAR